MTRHRVRPARQTPQPLLYMKPASWRGQGVAAADTSVPEEPDGAGGANLTVAGAPTFWGPPQEDSEMTERISLEGKVAVVTGAGRGLGRAYVELLAERGARVVVNDLGTDVSGFGKDSTIAQQVADLIRSRGGAAIANESDISTAEGGSDLVATTLEHCGSIELLVNNAGIVGSQP